MTELSNTSPIDWTGGSLRLTGFPGHGISESDPRIVAVVQMTRDMFGCEPKTEIDCDPEEPETPFVVFTVNCAGTPKEVIRRQLEWHRKVQELSPDLSGMIRISIDTP